MMTDIVERLPSLIGMGGIILEGGEVKQIVDTVASLRQRVKELEAIVVGCNKQRDKTEAELAALKKSQGEPVAWMYVADGFSTAWSKDRIPKENLFGKPV